MSEHKGLPLLVLLLVSSVSAFAQNHNGSSSQTVAPNTATTSDSKTPSPMTTGQAVAQSIIDAQNASPTPVIFLPQPPDASSASNDTPSTSGSTPSAGSSALHILQGTFAVAASPEGVAASTQGAAKLTGGVLVVSDYVRARSPAEELNALNAIDNFGWALVFEPGPGFAWAGLATAVGKAAFPKLFQDPLDKMLNDAYLNGFTTPEPVLPYINNQPSLSPNSSNSVTIETKLVADSPAPANSITIETGFVPDPSNDSTEAAAPSAPIVIVSSLLPDGPSIAGQTPWQSGSGSASPKQSFWGKLSNFGQGLAEFAQSPEGQQFLQSLPYLFPQSTAGPTRTSNGNGSMCGPGYVFNSAKMAAVPKVAELDAQGKSSQGTLLTRNPDGSLTAWCVPVGSRCDSYGRCTWPTHR